MGTVQQELVNVEEALEKVGRQIESLLEKQDSLEQQKTELLKALENQTVLENQDWSSTDFPWTLKAESSLKEIFKMNVFRPMQRSAINLTMAKKDCILVMPTGGGKSLCYQLPAAIDDGVTLVVSPLVSLMQDQLFALSQLPLEAAMLSASSSRSEVAAIQAAMLDNGSALKLLYVTPEKISKSKRFMARLQKMYKKGRFARLAVDEVHCCSNWGHDFRPDYKILGIMKRQFPDVPVMGLTATSTERVTKDVQKILSIQGCPVLKASFNRPNLYYEVRAKSSNFKESVQDIVHLIKTKYRNQTGIVYVFTRKESENVSQLMKASGVSAAGYHSDLTGSQRIKVHRDWTMGRVRVVVATVAFGMGIDKPDVRFVVHHSLSKSIENFYQESGRAGRDNQPSDCILYFRFADMFRQSVMVFTEHTGLTNFYNMVSYCHDVTTRKLIARYFGEVWSSSACNRMCDNCRAAGTPRPQDVTSHCVETLTLLRACGDRDERVTALKLLEQSGKRRKAGSSSSSSSSSSSCPAITRSERERLLTHMLLHEYLREDFHFTPYSTISYVLPGCKASVLASGAEVFMEKRAKQGGPPAAAEGATVSNHGGAKTKPGQKNKRAAEWIGKTVQSAKFSKTAVRSPGGPTVDQRQNGDTSALSTLAGDTTVAPPPVVMLNSDSNSSGGGGCDDDDALVFDLD